MALLDIIQQIMGGGPQNRLAGANMNPMSAEWLRSQGLYDRAESAPMMPRAMPQQMPAAQPQAPQMAAGAVSAAPAMQQPAPAQSAPAPSGGGFLERIFNPQGSAKNQTVQFLMQQGMDEGRARLFAGNKQALQQYLLASSQGMKPIEVNGKLVHPQTFQVLADFSDKDTETQRNLEWRARQAGLKPNTPEYADFMIKGGSGAINVDARQMGNIPPGYRAEYDDQGRVTQLVPIPGGPEDRSAAEAAAQENKATSGDVIMTAASRAREIARRGGRLATGIGGQLLSNIGETDAAELRRQVEVLKSNAKVENLQAMRAASPTGGALGNVSNQENEMLAAKAGALDPNAKPEDFQRALDDYERTLLRIVHGKQVGDAMFEQSRELEKEPVFNDNKQVFDAIQSGKIKVGDIIILNGKRMRVDP
jgi:hypothetical protein